MVYGESPHCINRAKAGTIERARRKSWMQGKEYRHYAVEGDPGHYSECLYNIEEIMRWIENQKQPVPKMQVPVNLLMLPDVWEVL